MHLITVKSTTGVIHINPNAIVCIEIYDVGILITLDTAKQVVISDKKDSEKFISEVGKI